MVELPGSLPQPSPGQIVDVYLPAELMTIEPWVGEIVDAARRYADACGWPADHPFRVPVTFLLWLWQTGQVELACRWTRRDAELEVIDWPSIERGEDSCTIDLSGMRFYELDMNGRRAGVGYDLHLAAAPEDDDDFDLDIPASQNPTVRIIARTEDELFGLLTAPLDPEAPPAVPEPAPTPPAKQRQQENAWLRREAGEWRKGGTAVQPDTATAELLWTAYEGKHSRAKLTGEARKKRLRAIVGRLHAWLPNG
jgi:hypothetical protein